MELTIETANSLRTNYLSLLERTMDIPISAVIRCSLIENCKILNESLNSFDTTRDTLVKQYGKNGVINKTEDPESYEIAEKELMELMQEKLNIPLNIMSITYDGVLEKLKLIDIPITQRELMSLQLICTPTE